MMTALQATNSERRNGRDGYECRVDGIALAEILKKSGVTKLGAKGGSS